MKKRLFYRPVMCIMCIICLWSMTSDRMTRAHAAEGCGDTKEAAKDTAFDAAGEEKPAPGDVCEVDGICYRLFNGIDGLEAEVVSYTDQLPKTALIPEMILEKETGLPVTLVGDGAFRNASVTKLVFPATVRGFGKDILSGCSNLDMVENHSQALLMLPDTMERKDHYFRYWRDDNYEEVRQIAGGSAYTLYTSHRYTLEFESNGGSPVEKITVFAYQCAAAPADPVREGYTFAGWYTSPYLSEESKWDFTKDYRNYTTTVRLYAKWKKSEKTSYQVDAVTGFQVKKRKKHSLTLTWSRLSTVTGYQLYMYDNAVKDFKLYSSTATNKENKITVYGLDAGRTYQFQLRAYSLVGGKRRHGEFTAVLRTVTKPDNPTRIKLQSPKKKQVKVKFKRVKSCSGYELQISTTKSFSKKNTRTYKLGKGAKSKTIKKLKSKKKYYVRIRAYIKYQGKTYYGAYSKKRKITCK